MNKKAVFLFGAGAVIDWGGPYTCRITSIIREIGFKAKNGKKITDEIYNILCSSPHVKKENINFETILNFIEELLIYHSSSNLEVSGNLLTALNLPDKLTNFLNYSIQANDSAKMYSLIIPERDSLNNKLTPNSIPPEQTFYELLLNELISGIICLITEYNSPKEDQDLNELVAQWMKRFVSSGYCLRLYTLNYDRLFKQILQENMIEVFEGFYGDEKFVGYEDDLDPNLPRIVSDFQSNVFYNLHGCAYWRLENLNVNHLPAYHYTLSGMPSMDGHTAIMAIEKGKKLFLSNIITGYQKAQRTALSPFRQMLSAFDRDCMEGDCLYIIGYSLGDEHINDIIRNARKYNSKLKIVFISPTFDDWDFSTSFLAHWGRPDGVIFQNVGDEIHSEQFQVRIVQQKFGDFLRTSPLHLTKILN